MKRIELSKCPRDVLIEILLKTNTWRYYKIRIGDINVREFYVKCRSKVEVMKIMAENENIKFEIIDFWKTFDSDIDILISTSDNEIIFWNCHNWGNVNTKYWRSLLDDNFESIVSSRFPELLQAWMNTELEGISIEKLDMITF